MTSGIEQLVIQTVAGILLLVFGASYGRATQPKGKGHCVSHEMMVQTATDIKEMLKELRTEIFPRMNKTEVNIREIATVVNGLVSTAQKISHDDDTKTIRLH